MAASRVLIIEPRDPFIARDGKPFGVGVSASTLLFPFPATTTGGVRTRAGLASGSFIDSNGQPNMKLISDVKEIATSGALLVGLDEEGEIENWFMPAPADALLLESENDKAKAKIKQLLPLAVSGGVTNLDQKPHKDDRLVPVGLAEFDPNKPFDESPRFWRWDHFQKWLLDPAKQPLVVNPKYLGHNGAVTQTRTHVALDPDTWTAREGQLFQTRGLEFTHCDERKFREADRLAMAVRVGEHPIAQLTEGLAPLGGERRTVAWRASEKQLPNECLDEIQTQVAQDMACRLVLLTPAYFTNGSRPSWLLSEQDKVKPELIGIANGRAQVISGWDLALIGAGHRGGLPKFTRRLMPAGSVFFLKLSAKNDSDVRKWVERIWMNCVSDDAPDGNKEQFRHDGFGLAVVGTWDGKLQEMKL